MNHEVRIGPDDWGEALADCDGYQLIVAGPGTGKTEFIVRRVGAIVASGKARRDEILVLCFSRRAARSIASRLDDHLGGSTVPIEATTFHSLALRLLERLDGAGPSPLTTPEQVATVRSLLHTEAPEDWPVTYRGVLTSPGFAEEVADFLMRCSERLLGPPDLAERARERADWRGLPDLYRRYLAHLDDTGRVDYGTLLVRAVERLGTPEGSELAARYRYVLVDEYQDTSPAQAKMSDLLSAGSGNLTVTGDPYQSIYSFRGAELRNVAEFEEGHDAVKRVVLDRSLRVPEEILSAALRVVSSGGLPGAAGPVRPAAHRGRVECYVFDQETAEAEWIAGQVDRAIRVDGSAPEQLAILMRSKQEMLNEMSRALSRRGIPHNRPDRRLIDHPAVQFVADVVTLALSDDATVGDGSERPVGGTADLAARRLLLGPLFALSLGYQRTLWARRHHGRRWSEVLSADDSLRGLAGLVDDSTWATDLPAVHGFWHLWSRLQQYSRVATDPARIEWRRAYASFAQVLDSQADRDPEMSLAEFFRVADDETFEATPLITHAPNEDGVVLTTLHQAKGLEFHQVFIANAVEGVFPDLRRSRRMLRPELLSPERTTDSTAVSAFQVQEEMRLAYTAMTRASRRVVWTATDAGVDQGERRPSRFLLAASGAESMSAIGRPDSEEQPPISLAEAEIALRRTAGDPLAPAPSRTAAVATLAASPRHSWDARLFPGVSERGPDRPILGERFSMSPSQADGYARCPRRYAVERRLRLGEPGSAYMSAGSIIHKALEVAETRVVGTDARHGDVDDAVAALSIEFENVDFGTPALNRAWMARAEAVVRKFYEKWPASSLPAIALEREVEMELDGVTWKGVVDRLEQGPEGVRVIDYKTGTNHPTKEEAEVSIQLGFYALAMNAASGPNVVAAELWYPATSAKSMTIRRLDIARLPEVEETMRLVTRQIAAEDWEPRVSAGCDRCSIKSSCPAWPEGRGAYLP